MTHGAVHANADRVTPYVPYHSLPSAGQALVVVPRISLERFDRRAFSCAGHSLGNSLLLHLRTQCVS